MIAGCALDLIHPSSLRRQGDSCSVTRERQKLPPVIVVDRIITGITIAVALIVVAALVALAFLVLTIWRHR